MKRLWPDRLAITCGIVPPATRKGVDRNTCELTYVGQYRVGRTRVKHGCLLWVLKCIRPKRQPSSNCLRAVDKFCWKQVLQTNKQTTARTLLKQSLTCTTHSTPENFGGIFKVHLLPQVPIRWLVVVVWLNFWGIRCIDDNLFPQKAHLF